MAKVIRYTERLGKEVAKKWADRRRRYHVISSFNKPGWSVVYEGAFRPVRQGFRTQQAAVSYAKAKSKTASEVVVHDKQGRIKDIVVLK